MTDELSEAHLGAARARIAGMEHPQEIADVLREREHNPMLEEIVKARLAELDGVWLLDELGGLRRPLTADQMADAEAAFADMETADIVRELLAEQYFFHPDVLPLADARLAELEGSHD